MTSDRFDLSTPEGRRRAERDFMWGDHAFLRIKFQNKHQISERMWRSNQPSPAHLEGWAALGIRTVVNLRGDTPTSFTALEKEACARLGLDLVFLPTESRGAPKVDRLKKARAAFETMAYPALMHCKSGADRAGFMAVFYLHVMEGRPLEEAFRQLDPKYLHMKQGKTGILDAFWVLWGEAMARGVTDFWTWLETEYDEAALKRNFRPSLFGDIVVDGLLRRE